MAKLRSVANRILSKLQTAKKNNDNQALANALSEFHDKLYTHLRIISAIYLDDYALSRECVTETFQKVYHYIGSFTEEKDGYNWLCKIVENIANDLNKDFKKYLFLDDVRFIPSYQTTEDEIVANMDLQNALSQLTNKQRCILRYVLKGYSFSEISVLMFLSKSTVFHHYQVALKNLRKILKNFRTNL